MTFTPEQLDAEWQRLAEGGDPKASELNTKFQELAHEYEETLVQLRRTAYDSLATCATCDSLRPTRNHPLKDIDPKAPQGKLCRDCYTSVYETLTPQQISQSHVSKEACSPTDIDDMCYICQSVNKPHSTS